MIKKFKNSKAFTLIELIVVIGVIGILVLIASSNFSGQKKDAKHNAALADMRIVADATDMYNIDNDDWPRLTDEHYTADELEAYSESFYDATGRKANLDTKGKYYDIDYDKLNQYAKAPVNKENYILQNPAGKVFYMRNLTSEGKERVDYSKPSEPVKPEEPGLYEFTSHTFTNAGQTGHTGPTQSMLDNAYKGSQVEGHVASNSGIQLWTAPKSGTYKIEAYGAQGGSSARGAVMIGDFIIEEGSILRVLIGQKGSCASGYSGRCGGGGGSFVVDKDNSPIIVAGGSAGYSTSKSNAKISNWGTDGGSFVGGVGAGGGGLIGDGKGSNNSYGKSLINGGIGGRNTNLSNQGLGGFGGGGGTDTSSTPRWGGGGGYTGGSGGYSNGSPTEGSNGGGGSFNSGTNQDNSVGHTGHGKVIITYIGE